MEVSTAFHSVQYAHAIAPYVIAPYAFIAIHKSGQAVIPAWMPESSAMDGNLVVAQVLD